MIYSEQRWLCRQAKQHGWTGKEPSVMGHHYADVAVAEAREFIKGLPESCRALIEAERQNLTLECPTCGNDGALADADGCFTDGQMLICGCSGWVSVDSESVPFINNDTLTPFEQEQAKLDAKPARYETINRFPPVKS